MDDGGGVPSLDLNKLKIVSALGRGAKGVVFLVQDGGGGGQMLALKAISRATIERKNRGNKVRGDGDDEYKRICFEQQVLSCYQHPLLPKLRGVLATDKIVGYAIDYCPGGDLNSLRNKQTEKMFSDDIIRFYAAELVLALEYLHGLGIVYRDLKPENIMIQDNGHLMLVDFDLSKKLPASTPEKQPMVIKSIPKSEPVKKKWFCALCGWCSSGISREDSVHPTEKSVKSVPSESALVEKSNSFVGTEEYVPPEMIRGDGHDFAVDWWCLGVVLYEMLYGTTPFKGTNRKETFYRILTKSPELVGEQTPLRDLIRQLLEKDPRQRISVEGIKGHDFFRGVDWNLILRISRPPFIPLRPQIEDMAGNKSIDVEAFVQGIFGAGGDDGENSVENKKMAENKKDDKDVNIKNGVWVEGLDHPSRHNNFFIF